MQLGFPVFYYCLLVLVSMRQPTLRLVSPQKKSSIYLVNNTWLLGLWNKIVFTFSRDAFPYPSTSPNLQDIQLYCDGKDSKKQVGSKWFKKFLQKPQMQRMVKRCLAQCWYLSTIDIKHTQWKRPSGTLPIPHWGTAGTRYGYMHTSVMWNTHTQAHWFTHTHANVCVWMTLLKG